MALFLYGTLRSDALRAAVAGEWITGQPATLTGYTVEGVQGDVVPFIRAEAAARCEGLLIEGYSRAAKARMDIYEIAFGYFLTDVTVQTADGPRAAQVYLPPDDAETDGQTWSLDRWQATHEAPGVLAATELFAHDPVPTGADLRRMWPMIERRAWSRLRRGQSHLPATLRHQPTSGDWSVAPDGPPLGRFFRLQGISVSHRRFDGGESGALPREVFMGIEAALVLPYDPERDRVLLVEQIRMGAAALGDPNPWMLEPVAGMIDARETPEQAALRETQEEAGISAVRLEHIASFYPSPGSSTDYFHAYLGLCRLDDTRSYGGGLETEAEDLRLHPIPFAQALKLVESGEVNAGPLQMMIYWLALNRDRLRGAAA